MPSPKEKAFLFHLYNYLNFGKTQKSQSDS